MPSKGIPRKKAGSIPDKLHAGRTAVQLVILGLLRREPECGYIIAKLLREKHDALSIPYGALYPILARMERRGLTRGSWKEGRGKYGRRVYELTPIGRKALQTTTRRWLQLIRQVTSLISP